MQLLLVSTQSSVCLLKDSKAFIIEWLENQSSFILLKQCHDNDDKIMKTNVNETSFKSYSWIELKALYESYFKALYEVIP